MRKARANACSAISIIIVSGCARVYVFICRRLVSHPTHYPLPTRLSFSVCCTNQDIRHGADGERYVYRTGLCVFSPDFDRLPRNVVDTCEEPDNNYVYANQGQLVDFDLALFEHFYDGLTQMRCVSLSLSLGVSLSVYVCVRVCVCVCVRVWVCLCDRV
jgi:hypothetical protein